MRRYLLILGIFAIFILKVDSVFADSSYVLPYPSAMPGNFFYKLDLIKEFVMKYWYYGDFGQFEYNLKESDKYLVEAKTLFEYKQYLLGFKALKKSDSYYQGVLPALQSASTHNKNISDKLYIRAEAAQKHMEVLSKIKDDVPQVFYWVPEKQKPSELNIWDAIDLSISIRGR